MEFFRCPCPETGNVILDGNDIGSNMDSSGNLLTKQCSTGPHTLTLRCPLGRICSPPKVTVVIENTTSSSPMEIHFDCHKLALEEYKVKQSDMLMNTATDHGSGDGVDDV